MIVDAATIRAVKQLIHLLQMRGETLATAESCTSGILSAAITHYPGTSALYFGGVNAYSNELKEKLLSVPKRCMIEHGSVSRPVAVIMAKKIREISGSDWGIAITGIAGPSGGSQAKPVGTIFGAIAKQGGLEHSWSQCFDGERETIRNQAVQGAIREFLSLLPSSP